MTTITRSDPVERQENLELFQFNLCVLLLLFHDDRHGALCNRQTIHYGPERTSLKGFGRIPHSDPSPLRLRNELHVGDVKQQNAI